jgi:hypothetical protein
VAADASDDDPTNIFKPEERPRKRPKIPSEDKAEENRQSEV